MCKVRGITLNFKVSRPLSSDTIKDLVLNGRSNSTVTVRTAKRIKRKRSEGACVSIVTDPEDKIYIVSFFKRRRIDDNTFVPFGYK